jgi:hypothetical protein
MGVLAENWAASRIPGLGEEGQANLRAVPACQEPLWPRDF